MSVNDNNVRILVLTKQDYYKYCATCKYCVKANWCKNEGFKYQMLDVYCCVDGGKKGITPMCPNGIYWGVLLGEVRTFDPKIYNGRG